MLISFEGEGCFNCPFYHYYYDKGDEGQECVMHKYTEDVPELFGCCGKKPNGCPFKGFPGNLEIQAMEAE